MFAFGEVHYRSERTFPMGLGLGTYLRRRKIDQVLMPNAYGNRWRLACYRRLRAEGFPTIVCDRGALPEAWFFDEGFLDDSDAYRPRRWDHALTAEERADTQRYLSKLRDSHDALETQGRRTEPSHLRERLGISRHERMLFVPLQRPHDTAVRYFGGPVSDHRRFERFVQELARRTADESSGWRVVVKQHPLEEAVPDLDGVALAAPSTHIHDLLEMADATLTLTSGVGLLSLAFGTPTLHLGRAFYGQPGLSQAVQTVAEAAQVLERLSPPDAHKVERFIHHLRTRVYSFGACTTRLARDAQGRRFRATERIDFRELRVLGEAHQVDGARVLVLSPVLPWPADRGSAARLDAMLTSIGQRGARVVLCAICPSGTECDAAIASLRARYPGASRIELVAHPGQGHRRVAREVRRVAAALSGGLSDVANLETCPPAFRRRVATLCSEFSPTHLLVNYAKLTPAIPADFDGVTIVDTHDCQTRLVEESQLHAGTRKHVSLARHERSEQMALSRYERIVAIHPQEAETFARWAPSAEVTFVPHFVEASPLPTLSVEDADYDAFFVGSGSSFNVLALRWLLEHVLPRVRREAPDYRFAAVGAMTTDVRIPEGLRSRAAMLGRVDDLDRIYRSTRVAAAPIRAGAGMKTKVVEALALRRPTVCTPVAADGIALRHGESAWIAADAPGFARGLLALHRDAELWERLATGGFDVHARDHTPAAVAARIEALIRPRAGAKRSAL